MPTRFPVLLDHRTRRDVPDAPRWVPWSVVEAVREQAEANHDQTLERLAQRGGLDPCELWAAANGKKLRDVRAMSIADALAWLRTVA